MRRIIVALILVSFLLVTLVPVANAEMAKEGTGSTTAIYSGTYKVMPLEKDTSVVTFEHTGVLTNDTGKAHCTICLFTVSGFITTKKE